MKIALVGNPNVGKTTLFNILTKSNQKIGNYPGVTVQKKIGKLNNEIEIIDLPGIYSLDSISIEEKIALNYIKNENPSIILNILDSSNLYRNLFLTFQLKQFNIPIILVLNMIDIAEKNNIHIDSKKLSDLLNCPVFLINANKKQGTLNLENYLKNTNFKSMKSSKNTDYNFSNSKDIYRKIDSILNVCVKTTKSNNNNFTEKLDLILMNKFLSVPILILIFFLIFKITFSWIGGPLSDILDNFISNTLTPFIENLLSNSSELFKSFILDGIIGGIGSIIVFLPIILTMFICLTFLESCGYIARAATIIDKFMRIFGLSGKAFLPIIMSFGCTVPAIMATRTFENEKDRKTCIFLLPLMSCNARLPVYILFTSIFFKNNRELVIMSLYLLGIIISIIIGLIMNLFSKEQNSEIFILEIPDYKIPSLSYMIKESLNKISSFFKKIGTLIFSISIIIWFLSNFNFSGFTSIENSFLFSIGNILAPIFIPLGFGFWQASVSLLTGLMAKEVIISSMGVIFGSNLDFILPSFFTPVSSISFLVFVLLYTPCISVLSTIKHEYGTKLMLTSVIYQLALAYSVSFLVFNILNIIW